MTIIASRDQYSEVLDERRRWRPDWYQWVSQLERSVYLNKSLQAGVRNVVNHGADNTGKGDSYDIIQSTWNKYGLIYLPAGTYLVSDTLIQPAINGAGIIGDGSAATSIIANFDGADVIQANNSFGPQYRGLQITRQTLATSGVGLNMSPIGVSVDNALLYDLFLVNHSTGIKLTNYAGVSEAQFIRASGNSFNGFEVGGQWQLLDTYSESNGYDGYQVYVAGSGPGAGPWRGLYSYGNGNKGIEFAGGPSNFLSRIRISDSIFQGDNTGGMYFDSYSQYPVVLNNVQVVTPNSGQGIAITVNNPSFHLSNCVILGPSSGGYGLFWDSPGLLFIHGGQFSGGSGGNGLVGTRGSASIHGAFFTTAGGGNSLALVNPMLNTTVVGCVAGGAAFVQTGTGTNYAAGNF